MTQYLPQIVRISLSCVVALGVLFSASQFVTSAHDSRNEVSAEIPLNELEVTLVPQGGSFIVQFRNLSGAPLQILKPIDGSEWAWAMPYYEFSLTDDQGGQYPRRSRCGMCGTPYADTVWPADYLRTIQPGEIYDHEGYLNYYFDEEKEYHVSFRYVFLPDSKYLRDGKTPYPTGLWQGEAKSQTIRIRLKPQPAVVG